MDGSQATAYEVRNIEINLSRVGRATSCKIAEIDGSSLVVVSDAMRSEEG